MFRILDQLVVELALSRSERLSRIGACPLPVTSAERVTVVRRVPKCSLVAVLDASCFKLSAKRLLGISGLPAECAVQPYVDKQIDAG